MSTVTIYDQHTIYHMGFKVREKAANKNIQPIAYAPADFTVRPHEVSTLMINNAQQLIDAFVADMAHYAGQTVDPNGITFDSWIAPHQPKDLPAGKAAVYVFSIRANANVPAGANRVIKVGKAGPNSNNRFRYQHYASGSANSTLAAAIENNALLWGFIGYPGKGTDTGAWLRKNTDRNNFYFSDHDIFGLFEVYAKARLGSVYEGSLSSGA